MNAPPGRYAVIGNPVAHSQSPFIHAAFAAQTGERVAYERLQCTDGGFAGAVRAFATGGAHGCNVTLPFKFEAFALCPRQSARAELAGACNTLRFDADGWFGDNTDGVGLLRDIERNAGVELHGLRVLVIGAGGGAAGVLGALLERAPAKVVVANRSLDRAERLVHRHRSAQRRTGVDRLEARPLDDCGTAFDVVVNASASSVTGAPVPVDGAVLRPGALAYDLMYGSAATGFLAWAGRGGAIGRDGLGMLVEQAAEAFELWRGVAPRTAPVLADLRARLAAP